MNRAVVPASGDSSVLHEMPPQDRSWVLLCDPGWCGGSPPAPVESVPTSSCPLFAPNPPFLPARQVSRGMEMVDHREAAPRAPQPVCIQLHFHHESGLAKLLLGGCSLLQPLLLPGPHTTSRALGHHRLLVTSWVSKAASHEGRGQVPRLPRPGRGSPSPLAMQAPCQPHSEQDAKPVLSSNQRSSSCFSRHLPLSESCR